METSLQKTYKYKTFNFDSYEFNKDTLKLELNYSLDNEIKFTETLQFEHKIDFKHINEGNLNTILKNVHLAFGVSYYKTYCPKNISLPFYKLTENEANFWSAFYKNSLGEFCFKNELDPSIIATFPFNNDYTLKAFNVELKKRYLLPIGGGKDSILSANILKHLGKDTTAFVLKPHKLIDAGIELLGLDAIRINRVLCPNIFELNKQGALNGHVPITGFISFLLILSAYLYDFSDVVLSLENSASEEQAYIGDFKVNHQYSKSIIFEEAFIKHLKENISKDFNYYSLLRPFNELLIAKLFASDALDCKKHFTSFSSCNKNFTIGNPLKERWCANCPKCAFVYLLFAPFLSDDDLNLIFEDNFLAKTALKETYLELLGLREHRPFECVGSLDETIVSFYLLYKQKRFLDTEPLKEFIKNIISTKTISELEALSKRVMSIQKEHFITDDKIIKFLKKLSLR
ncbi:MAG: hypothetical protein ACOX3T_02975 [Bdellovibrionota bacterium]